jgi:hypothetical protein
LSSTNKIKDHILHIREIYSSHMADVNLASKEMFTQKRISYKKFSGELDEESMPIFNIIKARIKDVSVTGDHDLMFDVIDYNNNNDIVFSFNIVEIEE